MSYGVQQIVVGRVGVSSPVGAPPLGTQDPEFGTASPLYRADVFPPMPVHDCGALQVWRDGGAQPIPSNVDTVPPEQSMLGGPQEQEVQPRVSVAAP
jgi:hypothetical protein